MKINKIDDIDKFLDSIDECTGRVMMVSEDGDRINLKGRLGGYLSLASIISNDFIKELDIEIDDPEDIKLLSSFLIV
ncbi:MAG: polya polymerase [Eubacteriales bacterium]|nr:polya polymerase [Eubacteriales bacterium]